MSRFSAASREAAGQVVAYPTRNFATLGTLLRPRFRTARSFRFRLALHVAVKVGPSLRSYGALSVWPLRILSWTSSIELRHCLPSRFIAYAISTMVDSPAG